MEFSAEGFVTSDELPAVGMALDLSRTDESEKVQMKKGWNLGIEDRPLGRCAFSSLYQRRRFIHHEV